RRLPARFWLLAFSSMFAMAGFIHWIHASYKLSGYGAEYLAYLYSLAMLVDAAAALALGVAYDRVGGAAVAIVPLVAGISTITLLAGLDAALFAILWGAAMGGFQSVYRSILADSLGPGVRGLGFGLLYFMMGVGWSLGNIALSLVEEPGTSITMVAFLELLATLLLALYLRSQR
ncbi:MAG: hypothetical protein LRS43_04545, partial [Desulfurococcales archaeon]|nr:hypothetical protein [Desulfurococcales archaeon]